MNRWQASGKLISSGKMNSMKKSENYEDLVYCVQLERALFCESYIARIVIILWN